VTPMPPRSVRNVRKRRASEDELVALPGSTPPPPSSRGEGKLFQFARAALGALLVVAIGGGAAWGARRYVTTSPRFAIREIVTTGENRRTPDELAAIASIAKGDNVFSVDLEGARGRLLADPWISEATLSRQLPGTVFVRIVEREPGGILATNDGTYVVARDGEIIKPIEVGDPTDLHVVTGITIRELMDDREGATRSVRRALDLAADYERSALSRRSTLQEVHVEPNGEMTLVIGKSTVSLRMGTGPYRRKIEQAARVLAELDRRGAKADSVMLDDEARPDRVVVRMR
jgi:cell division protein FtsQ